MGDLVQNKLNEPTTFLGTKNSGNFREGDKRFSNPTRIKEVLPFPGAVPFRYLVATSPHASYTEGQLRLYSP